MNNKIDTIIEELKTLTLLEAAELVKQIEEVFDVDASAAASNSMVMMPAGGNTSAEEATEKTEFDVFLEDVPSDKKIAILKVVRSITGLGLKEAKDLVESAPKVLKEGTSKDDAEDMKSQLEKAGATVVIK